MERSRPRIFWTGHLVATRVQGQAPALPRPKWPKLPAILSFLDGGTTQRGSIRSSSCCRQPLSVTRIWAQNREIWKCDRECDAECPSRPVPGSSRAIQASFRRMRRWLPWIMLGYGRLSKIVRLFDCLPDLAIAKPKPSQVHPLRGCSAS